MDPKVRTLYKNLIYLGKFHPMGISKFRDKLKDKFNHSTYNNAEELKQHLINGKMFGKELEHFYSFKTYRAVYKKYYNN